MTDKKHNMMFGDKTYNKLTLLAAGTALSAFMLAANPAIADQTTASDNDVECPEDTPVKDLTDEQRKSCLSEEEESNNEDFVTRLHGKLDYDKAEDILEDLREFAAEDPEREITFYINSPGGSLSQAFAIYDTMQDIPNDIRTVCEGWAMSAGMFLLTAGTPGKRQALPNCDIMAHQSSSSAIGHIEDNRVRMEHLKHQNERFVQLIADHSGWDVGTLTDIMSHNAYLTAAESQEMGFIDEIVQPTKPLPAATTRKTQDDLPDWFCEGERAQTMRVCVTP